MILVLEDDVLIQDTIILALEEGGFEVAATTSAAEALAMFESNGECQALVTDVDLGARSETGWIAARRARELIPTLPIVYVTGSSHEEWAANGVPHSILVAKPFAPAQIVTAVSQLLNAGGAGSS